MPYIEDIDAIVQARSESDFLNRMEGYFKSELINRYLYIFMPPESQFNSDTIEFSHFGYEHIPCIIQPLKKFVSSPQGAKFFKLSTSAMLKPIYEDDDFFNAQILQEKSLNWLDSDKNARCLYIPVHAGRSFTGLFYLRGDKDNTDLGHNPREAQMICQMFHQRYCELWTRPSHRSIKLTERETEILYWMAQGKSNSVIGDLIGLSKHTVDVYLRTVFTKLSVSNRTSAAVKASKLGLLQPYIPQYSPNTYADNVQYLKSGQLYPSLKSTFRA